MKRLFYGLSVVLLALTIIAAWGLFFAAALDPGPNQVLTDLALPLYLAVVLAGSTVLGFWIGGKP